MMRHPINRLPKYIDPLAFAKARQIEEIILPLSETSELKKWATDNEQSLEAKLEGYIDADQQVHLAGEVKASLNTECQRCLEPMALEVGHQFDYVVICDAALEDQVEGGFETIISGDELDIAWFVEEEVLLAMPMIAKHEHCEAQQNVLPSGQITDNTRQYPFTKLKEMMNSKEH